MRVGVFEFHRVGTAGAHEDAYRKVDEIAYTGEVLGCFHCLRRMGFYRQFGGGG